MNTEETKALEKQIAKLKFIAGQKASELHDLVEDRLWGDFEDIPAVAETTYKACRAWKDKVDELKEKTSA
ncbi:CCE_0567 family metalloprotein [Pontiellaceae bacterium B1224]|nr:CCE_0567 family metalloprotein [Pontiellaceae bacterium B1224]